MAIDRRRLTAALATLVLIALGPTAALAHPPVTLSPAAEAATADEILAFRQALAAAITAKDAAKLRTMYTDGFTHTHTTGRIDGRDTRIAAAVAGDAVIETAPAEDLVIRVPGGWTGIAIGVSPIRSMADGGTVRVRWTAVYVRGPAGDWQLAASHATRVGDLRQ
jgi:ketosteroid isomerase-like protein